MSTTQAYSNGFNQFVGQLTRGVIGDERLANATDFQLYAGVGAVSVAAGFGGAFAAGAYGSALAGAAQTYGMTMVGVGVGAGVLNGVGTSVAADIYAGRDISFSSAAISGAIGGAFGALNPYESIATLAGGAGGSLIGAAYGGWTGGLSGAMKGAAGGYLTGSFIGGIAGVGIDDYQRLKGMYVVASQIRSHVAMRTALTATVGAGVAGGTYAATGGDLEKALFYGNFGVMAGSIMAKSLIPCFPAGTPILTPNGPVPIEQLQAGDVVLSRDEHNVNGEVGPKAIEETFIRHGEIYELCVAGETIRVTPEHPVYVEDRGWTPVGEVEPGNRLASIHLRVPAAVGADDPIPPISQPSTLDTQPCWTSEWLEVESNQSTGEFTTVYNFRVADWHTYFVGGDACGLWVHNASRDYIAGSYDFLEPINGRQKHHLLQQKAFPDALNVNSGPVVSVAGSTFAEGSQHNIIHRVLEGFWEPHRIAHTTPLIGDYLEAASRAARTAGYSAKDAYQMRRSAERFLKRLELTADDFVPNVPGRFPSQFLPGGLL